MTPCSNAAVRAPCQAPDRGSLWQAAAYRAPALTETLICSGWLYWLAIQHVSVKTHLATQKISSLSASQETHSADSDECWFSMLCLLPFKRSLDPKSFAVSGVSLLGVNSHWIRLWICDVEQLIWNRLGSNFLYSVVQVISRLTGCPHLFCTGG